MNKLLWIKDILTNSENSTNEELVDYFMSEGLNEKEARKWVGKRSFYANNIVLHDTTGNDVAIYKA